MSGTFEHYQRYNNIVELISGKTAEEYPALKLIIHVFEQELERTRNIRFRPLLQADTNNIFQMIVTIQN